MAFPYQVLNRTKTALESGMCAYGHTPMGSITEAIGDTWRRKHKVGVAHGGTQAATAATAPSA